MADSIYVFEARTLDGKPMPMADLKGKVVLIVNTASACGFTPQYAGLEALHQRYAAEGLAVVGFPCNQFGGQEPGGAEEIGAFCQKNYGVSFRMAEKVDVNGEHAHPLFRHLSDEAPGILGSKSIKWNFTKFLVNRSGQVVERFAPTTKPEELAPRIEALLAEA